jgi:hypothetical protein
LDNSNLVWIIAAQKNNLPYERSSKKQSYRKPIREFKKLILNGLWLLFFCSGWACAKLNTMLQNPHSRTYDLHKLLNQLPKEVLVEKIYKNIICSPVAEGIRAFRALDQNLSRAFNDSEDHLTIEAFAEPQKNYINLMFDLHDEIEGILEKQTGQLEKLERETAAQKQELIDKAG